MEKKFNESGEINPQYKKQIIGACEEQDINYFVAKVEEARQYFDTRRKEGWPSIKNMNDLNVECHIVPFCKSCIEYLKTGKFVDVGLTYM